MNPEQKIMHAILTEAVSREDGLTLDVEVTAENIGELYDEMLVERDLHWDYQSEFREGQVETDIPCWCSRHYESRSVAAQMPDGTWVGWTYWYGGGKHAEPESIDWMSDAYFLECTEEEKVVVVREFSKVEALA